MDIRKIDNALSVTGQIQPNDVEEIAARGFRAIIGNRPDGEEPSQPEWRAIAAAAEAQGLQARHIPVGGAQTVESQTPAFAKALAELPKPALAFCRTGNRSAQLHDRASATAQPSGRRRHRVVIAGGGSGGLAAAASLLKRRRNLDIAVIEPSEQHYYQPGWTMVGGGVFRAEKTAQREADVMPDGVTWIRSAVAGFDPDAQTVELDDGSRVSYDLLIVAMGNRLAWEEVEGLEDTLGRNGVTSNYRYDLAPYTWQLVQQLRSGRAIFTQPAMPIKCAGAPQKAMYLSCSEWEEQDTLGNIDVQFHNQGGAIFGVQEYVPALMDTVRRYGIGLNFGSNLIRVDGEAKKAWFATEDGEIERDFDMLHVCPPQKGNAVVAGSALANDAGYAEVDQQTLRHTRYPDVFALGDCGSTPNAKTMAAARKQAPVVAVNALNVLDGKEPGAAYDGYGSCPLTVENGKIVLAEFLYGGKVAPSFPAWLNDGTKPSRLAWHLKADMLPFIYWHGMLKGREWLAAPADLSAA
ncbi:bifunctional protein tyrosine phosphatase family protein/NAD(P)/FAD-dependent oxidoreductase [Pacificimonas flava]|uniref:Oxidoreductase (Flavoprotein) n=1 Tax=Pacificimonas flava TaxID=1234595 RepID=M2T5S7_9SPHN|nr:bifunctional protein tyrosine phosphatase family protein/NAD(P)/FAD-dependent oxidoreductase [Pacificimonas flava]EMD81829.1 Oxidoreductase (flavoprotein) [Pacificimonas flava]MBB5281641.1 sulfide:quinone oxidoreductase [Pacificimonas flava]